VKPPTTELGSAPYAQLQRNGTPPSDLATMKEHVVRHGDHLMVVSFVDAPVFLTEPFIRTTNYVYSPAPNANAWGSGNS
jgi:hypothetical protein